MKVNLLRLGSALFVLFALASCEIRYPTGRVTIPDERPSLAFKGAPAGSVVFVDGNAMGSAAQFDGGERVLLVEPGNHIVQVRLGDRVLLKRNVFLAGRATKTFVVR